MSKTPPRTTDIDPVAAVDGRMFLGTLDDSVGRYRWEGGIDSGRSLDAALIYHGLLGPRLCCRIGNLLYQPGLLRHALSDEGPLASFCRTGFFELHSRADGFNSTIESRLDEGTNTTLAFRDAQGWKKGSAVHQRIDEFERKITSRGRRQYRPNFQTAFQRLADLAAADAPASFKAVFECWTAQFGGRTRTRSNFEIVCGEIHAADRIARREAMSIVNSVNHYAYGIGMVSLTGETGEIPFIDTMELDALTPFTHSVLGDDDRSVESERLFELIKTRAFDIVQTHLVVPIDLFRSRERWDRFAGLLDIDHATPSATEFRGRKAAVLFGIKQLLETENVETARRNLIAQCKDYTRFLRSELHAKGAPTTGIRAILWSERAGRVPGALADLSADKLREAIVNAVTSDWKAEVAKAALNVVVSVFSPDIGNPVTRAIDRGWARNVEPMEQAIALRAFERTLSVKQINSKQAHRVGLA